MPGIFTTFTGAAFLRALASVSSLSALSGGTCVSRSPCDDQHGLLNILHQLRRIERQKTLEVRRVGLVPDRLGHVDLIPAESGDDRLLNLFLQIDRRLSL